MRKDVIEEVKESGVCSILADETKDFIKKGTYFIRTQVLLQRYSA